MNDFRKHFDAGSVLVILITLSFFVVALFAKGLTHDLLLEAGVFLVSVKLIMMAYKSSVTTGKLLARLDDIQAALQRYAPPAGPAQPSRPTDGATTPPGVERAGG